MNLEEEFETEEEEGIEIPNLNFDDLKILKTMWEAKDTVSIGNITKKAFDIKDRKDFQGKYNKVKYRLNKLDEEGVINKKEFEEGDAYLIPDNVFLGELTAEMDVAGKKEEMEFDKALFIQVDGTAMFFSLNHV